MYDEFFSMSRDLCWPCWPCCPRFPRWWTALTACSPDITCICSVVASAAWTIPYALSSVRLVSRSNLSRILASRRPCTNRSRRISLAVIVPKSQLSAVHILYFVEGYNIPRICWARLVCCYPHFLHHRIQRYRTLWRHLLLWLIGVCIPFSCRLPHQSPLLFQTFPGFFSPKFPQARPRFVIYVFGNFRLNYKVSS